jgi:hypothetical protein
LRPRKTRPVYICLRSYQDWLQDALEDMGAQAGPRQVVMARRTSLTLPVEEGRRVLVTNRNAEPWGEPAQHSNPCAQHPGAL